MGSRTTPQSGQLSAALRAPLRAPRAALLPGLDGIRAIAVLAVMLYHFDWVRMPGGFLGVDIFFVLSGYLITSQLWARWSEGPIRLGTFWAARIRRLLPAVLLLLPVTTVAMMLSSRDQLRAFAGDVLAAGSYTSNWWYVLHQRSYFEASGRPPVLQHLWSLAVEEQFYLIWPLVVAAIFVLARREHARQITLYAVALAMAAGSASIMWLGTASAQVPQMGDPSRWYFGTDSHAMGLLLGAALAVARRGRGFSPTRATLPRAGTVRTGIGIVALAMLLVVATQVDAYSIPLYRWGFGAVALLTVLTLWAVTCPGPLANLLGTQPLRYLGQRSYGLYLWHWPVACFTRPQLDVPWDGWQVMMLRFALTVALAEASYRLVEQPVRLHGWREAWIRLRERHLSMPATIGATLVAIALTVGAASPVPATTTETTLLAATDPHGGPNGQAPTPPGTLSPAAATGDKERATPKPTPRTAPASAGSSGPARPAGSKPTPKTTLTGTPKDTPNGTASTPATDSTAGKSIAVYGDSVALGAEPGLRQAFASVDNEARIGEQSWTLLGNLTARVPRISADVVLIHTGNNGIVMADQLRSTLRALRSAKRVIVVVPRVPRQWQQTNLRSVRRGAAGFTNVQIADWFEESAGHPEYFEGDGLHLNRIGLKAYTRMIQRAAS